MLEKIGTNDIIVRDYTDNFAVKEYIQSVLIPQAFPTVPVSKLNAGFTGVVSEYISQLVEDSYHTSSLMLNENFITRAILPNSIYSEAGLFDLGYTFATPSKCNFAIQIWIQDILDRGQPVEQQLTVDDSRTLKDTGRYRYILDRDTRIIVGDYSYRFDYDVIIEWRKRYVNGRELIPFKARYDAPDARDADSETGFFNSIALSDNKWIKCRVSKKGWLILLVTMQEFSRTIQEETISDNLRTTASDIMLRWGNQIAGLDLVHIDTAGQRRPMKKKIQYTNFETIPFAYYSFTDDYSIRLNFSPNASAWNPQFNDRIEATIYTTSGKAANFETYDRTIPVIVEKSGERYEYNADTHIVAACYSGSSLGTDKKDIEMLRSDVKLAYNTAKVLSTDHDLMEWFTNYAMRYDTKSTFFKRRDDPTGRLFSHFVAITDGDYVYPTNTLTIDTEEATDFDYVDDEHTEFVIKPGHLWEYKMDATTGELSRNTVKMIKRTDGTNAMIHDNPLPRIETHRPFIFVNPFLIKIHRSPQLSACYNYLINHTSFLNDEYTNEDSEFRHFQLSSLTINRSLVQRGTSSTHVDCYTVRTVVNPILLEGDISDDYRYIKGAITDPDGADYTTNNLRLVLVFDTKLYGETGYIEMYPVGINEAGIMEYEVKFAVVDNISKEKLLVIDDVKTVSVLLNDSINYITNTNRPSAYATKAVIEAQESRFKIVALLKVDQYVTDVLNLIPSTPPFGDSRFTGYQVANRYANDYTELTLYQPLGMMRSSVVFGGSPGSYLIRANLMPFIGYRLATDELSLSKFIRQFNEQYAVVEPVIFERLDNNCHLDMKFYNTYGRSNNYYIGDTDNLMLLDDVSVRITFQLSVKDRMAWQATSDSVVNDIRDFFAAINQSSQPNLYVSNLIKLIEANNPNVDHLKFLGINDYDATEQYIRVRYTDVSDLDTESEMRIVVPELIQCYPVNITLIEEG